MHGGISQHMVTTVHLVSLAARNLRRQLRRTSLALLMVSGGVIAMLLTEGFVEWMFFALRDSVIHSQLGHIQITREGSFSDGRGDPFAHLLPARIDDSAREHAGAIVVSTPRLAFSGMVSTGESSVSFLGEGIDPVREVKITKGLPIVSGRNLERADERSTVLGQGLAAAIGAQIGDHVVLLARTAAGNTNAVELEVVGLFAAMMKSYDENVLRIPIDVARTLVKVEGATSWVLLLNSDDASAAETARLRQTLSERDYEITPWFTLADYYNKTVNLFSRQLLVIRILIALIVILTILNTLTMTIRERTSEIGTMLALGVRRRDVLLQFLTEGALLGCAGGLLGILLGWVLAVAISAVGIPMPPAPGMTSGYVGEIRITSSMLVHALLGGVFITVLACIPPATSASKMAIVDALRHSR